MSKLIKYNRNKKKINQSGDKLKILPFLETKHVKIISVVVTLKIFVSDIPYGVHTRRQSVGGTRGQGNKNREKSMKKLHSTQQQGRVK